MEKNEISIHEVRAYLALKAHQGWITSKELSDKIERGVPRTVRAHLLKFVRLGLVDQAEVFPAHRYRWSELGNRRNVAYSRRIEEAASIFGLL